MGARRTNYAMGQALWIGDWCVEPSLDLIRGGEQTVKLEPRKMRLLMALAERPGELVLADELIDAVWKDVVVTPNSLYQSVAQLRRQLGDETDHPRYIVTVPRKGYRLVAPVRPAAADAAALDPSWQPQAAWPQPSEAPAPAVRGMWPATEVAAAAPAAEGLGPEPAPLTELPTPMPAASPSSDTAGRRSPATSAPASKGRRAAIAAAAVLPVLGGATLWWWRADPRGAAGDPLRLAVTAFSDESPGLDGPALADALSEEVIRQLADDARLRVVARDSSHAFRAGALDPAEVARQLGVALVLEGAVRREGDAVRLTLTLHDTQAARVRWSDRLARPMAQLPQLPRLVAEHTRAALGLATRPPAPARPEPPLAAFEAYVQGMHALRQRTPEALQAARGQFERAIVIAPGFAEAHAALAGAWLAETDYGVSFDYETALDHARSAIERALAEAPDAPDVLAVQGLLHIKLREHERAREPLRRAIALRPSLAAAHFWLGVTYAYEGRPREAMPHYAVAAELNPLDFQIHTRLGTETMFAGLGEQALRHFDRARELAPQHPNPWWGHALVGYARGRLDDAVLGYRAALALEKRRADLWLELASVYADLDLTAQARQAMAAYRTHGGWPSDYGAVMLRQGIDAGVEARGAPPAVPAGKAATLGDWLGAALGAAQRGDAASAREALAEIVSRWPREHTHVHGPYGVFLDRLPALDVAAVALWLRDRDADAWLAMARDEIARYERGGCVWHSLLHQRARLLALGGDADASITALRAAVDAGWRRVRGIARDPAWAAVAARPDLVALVETVRPEIARQRERVLREGG